jgi:hypothetical protein
MYDLCRHIKTNGKRCQSPALSGSAYCYFHSRVHTMAKTKSTIWDNIYLPVLEDSASIQVAISQITGAYLCSRLDARHTGLLLYALQIASQNIDRKSYHPDSEMVRSMTVTAEGDELAPEEEVCEPGDCASCDRRDTCDDYDPDADESDSDEDEDNCDSVDDDCDSDEGDCESEEENEEPDAPSLDSGTEQAAEKNFALKGHGFSRAEDATKLSRALAPEGGLSLIPPENPNVSATARETPNRMIANGEPLYPLRSAIPGAPGPSHLGTWDTTNPMREALLPGRPVPPLRAAIPTG